MSGTPTSTLTASRPVASTDLYEWMWPWDHMLLDLGTGDGAYALHRARQDASLGVIALDLRLNRLPKHARRRPQLANLRFVEADAVAWCAELAARGVRVDEIAINFPYGALLRACIGDGVFVTNLARVLRPSGHLGLLLNVRALIDSAPETTWNDALHGVTSALRMHGFRDVATNPLSATALRTIPSTWGKRIGWGRPTEAVRITARGGPTTSLTQGISICDIPCYDDGVRKEQP